MRSVLIRHVLRIAAGSVLLLTTVLSIAMPASAQTYVFGRADFTTGNYPFAVVTGDFNGDGKPDLAVSNQWDNTVSILLAQPDGSFGPKTDYAVGRGPYGLAVADFNLDGNLDLAVANNDDNTVSILLGNGDGTFRTGATVATASNPWAVAAGDFNGDKKPDLAVTNSDSNSVSVLLGKGDGTFDPKVDYATGNAPDSIVTGDFNADGNLDLAVANLGDNSISILLGRGDGTFQKAVSYSPGGTSLALGDFNGDGKLDLAATWSNNVAILLGNGDGTFGPAASYTAAVGSSTAHSVAVGDFNRDGKLDLALADNGVLNCLAVLLGNGDGTFQTAIFYDYGTQSAPYSVTVADFNGDGTPDVALTNGALTTDGVTPNTVSVLLGNSDGSFEPKATSVGGDHTTFGAMAAGDFNGDGKMDIAAAGGDPYFCYPVCSGVFIMLGNGDGTFTSTMYDTYELSAVPGPLPTTLEVGDFNGDSKLDIAVAVPTATTNTWYLLRGNGDGTFQEPVTLNGPPSGTPFMPFVDFNGDGIADQAVATASGVSIELGLPGGSFQTLPGPSGLLVAPAPADYNGDGITDLAVFNIPGGGESPLLEVFLNYPFVALYPDNLTFPPQPVGMASAPQNITVSNPGLALLKISGVTATGPFAETNDCPATVPAGTQCSIAVTFMPEGEGSSTGSITIADNAEGSPHVISLTGSSGAGLSLTPASLSFGDQPVGTAGPAKTVTLTNTGNATLTISGVTASGDFVAANTCKGSVAAGASCVITVVFKPSAGGLRNGTVTITDNTVNSPQTIPLTGTGTTPAVSLSPNGLSFGGRLAGQSGGPAPVLLTNTGAAPLDISSIAFTGSGAGDFSQQNNCGSSVAIGATCSINVTFKPAIGGTLSANLAVTDNAPGSPQIVGITGVGNDFSLEPVSGSSSSATVTAGQSATYKIAADVTGDLTGTISLSCAGTPTAAACTVNPASVSVGPGVPSSTIVITVTTTARSQVPPRRPKWPPISQRPMIPFVCLLALLLLASLAVLHTRHTGQPAARVSLMRRRLPMLALIPALILVLALIMSACGGSSTVVTTTTGTPAGTYMISVTGTYTAGSASLQNSVTLTLVVQ